MRDHPTRIAGAAPHYGALKVAGDPVSAERDARARLAQRYNRHGARPVTHETTPIGSSGDAVNAVTMSLWAHGYYTDAADADDLKRYPVPTRDDVLDALAQIVDYRSNVDDDEHRLILAARELGVEWEEIGEALGYPTRSAKQSARARASRLAQSGKTRANRYVRRRPLVIEQPAESAPAPAANDADPNPWPLPGEDRRHDPADEPAAPSPTIEPEGIRS